MTTETRQDLRAYVPRGTTHTFASVGPEEGKPLTVTLPGLDRYLEQGWG